MTEREPLREDLRRSAAPSGQRDDRSAGGQGHRRTRSALRTLGRIIVWMMRYPYIILILVLAIAVAVFLRHMKSTSHIETTHTEAIEKTATQLTSIRNIGQWECMRITTEEIVDTTEKHLLGDRELTRIYHGTLILGVDLKKAEASWFTARGDTAIVTLPPVSLLNPDFIDESRTRTFYEKGHFDAAVSDALYEKARRQMLSRSLTPSVMDQAGENMRQRIEALFRSFGYKQVVFSQAGNIEQSAK